MLLVVIGLKLTGISIHIQSVQASCSASSSLSSSSSSIRRGCCGVSGALRLLRKRPQDPEGFPKALAVSAVEGAGIETAWAEMQNLAQWRREAGIWGETRATQAAHWFETELREGLLARLRENKTIRAAIETRVRDVAEGKISPDAAAAEILGKMAP